MKTIKLLKEEGEGRRTHLILMYVILSSSYITLCHYGDMKNDRKKFVFQFLSL